MHHIIYTLDEDGPFFVLTNQTREDFERIIKTGKISSLSLGTLKIIHPKYIALVEEVEGYDFSVGKYRPEREIKKVVEEKEKDGDS